MKRLLKKLHSQRGASILLALLMLLVCMMVGSSVLAASASNAGKAKSNRVEQQRYLNLSSAIQLIAEELEKAEYTGKYKLWEWEVTTTVTDYSDSANPITTTTSKSFFYCQQTEGVYSCGDLTNQLPLGKELDEIFSQQFTAKGGKAAGYEALEGANVESSAVRTLTVSLPEGLSGYPDSGPAQYQVPREVTVQVKLDHATKHILLTAWLGNEPDAPADGKDTMIAELVAVEGTAPVLDYSPSGKEPGEWGTDRPKIPESTAAGANPRIEVSISSNGELKSPGTPMQWKLNWIKKGAV